MPKNVKIIKHIPNKYRDFLLFRNVFLKEGNKERASRYLTDLSFLLKITFHKQKKTSRVLKRPRPYQLLNQLLYKLKPAFIIRRVTVSGKTYQLPVPITDHRASFLACHWIRKAILSDTKSATTIPHLMLKELLNLTKNKGEAIAQLKAYIELAIDQRPFSRFIRKKRKKRRDDEVYHRIINNKMQRTSHKRRKIKRRLKYLTYRKDRRFRRAKKQYTFNHIKGRRRAIKATIPLKNQTDSIKDTKLLKRVLHYKKRVKLLTIKSKILRKKNRARRKYKSRRL